MIVVCVWKYADQKTVENTKIITAAYKRPLSYLDPFKSSLFSSADSCLFLPTGYFPESPSNLFLPNVNNRNVINKQIETH